MSSVINTNIASLNAQRNLSSSQTSLQTSLQRLSSGLRINSAKDDAAGLAISTRMTSQINGLDQAARNANDAISMTQTAEGGLSTIGDMLQRMRDLSVQAANGSNTSTDRAALQKEVGQLKQEIDRTATTTQFNGQNILDGSMSNVQFQVGANANQTVGFKIGSARATDLGVAGQTSSTTVSSGPTTHALAAGDLTLNGQQVGASTAGTQPGQAADSAYAVAQAINAVSSQSGVTATANATTVGGTTAPAATYAGASATVNGHIAANTFSINGVNVGDIANGGNAAGQGANVAAAINKISSQTGVTASADANTGAVTLTATDGRNIDLGINGTAATQAAATDQASMLNTLTGLTFGTQAYNDTSTTPATSGAATDAITRGTVTLASTSSSGIEIGGGNAAYAGFNAAAMGLHQPTTVSSVDSIANIDISTADGAQKALATIDGALGQISDSRAAMGALQNRFTSTIGNLQSSSTNMSAARSRIQDTDFAAESANMTRSQILQQAGTAMLAQANQLPNSVMSLLR